MESHEEIQKAKNPEKNERKSNYLIIRESQKVGGTSTEKKVQYCCDPPPPTTAKTSYPPGYRFMPTDDELILEYLQKKVMNESVPEISEIYLKQNNPKALTETYPKLGENEWYFFTPRDRKYPNGSRPNRAADTGYWKATGADKPVRFEDKVIGFRKALVFYEGKPPKGQKTSWIMHEFRLNQRPRNKRSADDMRLDDWVLCRIYEKTSRPNNRNQRGNECVDSVDDNQDHIRLNNDNDENSSAALNHEKARVVVNNNENLATFDMAENLASFGDHWLQQNLLISPPHSIDEPALINGHFQSSILDYGLVNPVGATCSNEGFQQGDFQEVPTWAIPSYYGHSSSTSTNTTLYDSFSFMKVEDPFINGIVNNPNYNQFMPEERKTLKGFRY